MANVNEIGGAYSGSYIYQGSYYVHYHAKHIGRAMNGTSLSPNQLVNTFKESKKQAFQASKTQYTRLFFDSLSKESQELLNEVLDINSQLMRELQIQIGKKLEESLSSNKITELLQISKKTPASLIADAMSKSKLMLRVLINFYIILQRLPLYYREKQVLI